MEKDYWEMCQQDGWEEALKYLRLSSSKQVRKAAEPVEVVSGAEIPLDSDYYRVSVEGAGDFRPFLELSEAGGSSESTRRPGLLFKLRLECQ